MFKNRDCYLLNFLDQTNVILQNSRGQEIIKKELYFDDNGQIDLDQLEYLIKKAVETIKPQALLVVRIADSSNVFRFEIAQGLEKKDLENYYAFNLNKLLPFNKENLVIKYDYWRENFVIFGLKKTYVNTIFKKLENLGYKNVFLTCFASEILSYVENEKINSVLAIRADYTSLEIIKIQDKQILFYKYKRFFLDSFSKEIQHLAKSIAIEESKEFLIFGDRIFINEYKDLIDKSFGQEFIYTNFNLENYFGD